MMMVGYEIVGKETTWILFCEMKTIENIEN